MADVKYSIDQFTWNPSDQMLTAERKDLWAEGTYYQFPFPNDRRQFYIHNKKTQGFRRFRLVEEMRNRSLLFTSEDGLLCLIKC